MSDTFDHESDAMDDLMDYEYWGKVHKMPMGKLDKTKNPKKICQFCGRMKVSNYVICICEVLPYKEV
jgi:hypothetical protein